MEAQQGISEKFAGPVGEFAGGGGFAVGGVGSRSRTRVRSDAKYSISEELGSWCCLEHGVLRTGKCFGALLGNRAHGKVFDAALVSVPGLPEQFSPQRFGGPSS